MHGCCVFDNYRKSSSIYTGKKNSNTLFRLNRSSQGLVFETVRSCRCVFLLNCDDRLSERNGQLLEQDHDYRLSLVHIPHDCGSRSSPLMDGSLILAAIRPVASYFGTLEMSLLEYTITICFGLIKACVADSFILDNLHVINSICYDSMNKHASS